ncbi:VWA domain-containing protein (plasmid) [Deinococcus psychrotolerans]|uniref:VWA domain-containing protein n=1 Tax=Deinococcus psychrotolerans TaxID=2489213 RepID=A0A3G8YHD5_9DEIO|nr:VWA domain-containing protein [Deinococcus psychrotolerans]AZI44698.1 VWA domain-containing protein [Deinococcus psychrotolerans]
MTSFALFPLLSSLLVPTPLSAASVLGLSSPPIHMVIAVDMTGSSKNPAFQYAPQARLIAQNVMLNQVKSGDSVTLLQVCSGVKTIADFQYQGANGARMPKSDILRYSNALTAPCKGRGSAITAGFSAATSAGQRTKDAKTVVVYFTDGAVLDDPQRSTLPSVFSKLLGRSTATVFIAGLSPEADATGSSIRDSFTAQLGKAANDKRVILAGAYDLANVYPSFAAAVKADRR